MLLIYNRILLIFLLNAVDNCTLHAFHLYTFFSFFVILHYHCIYYVFKYGILCISRDVLLEACNKDLLFIIIIIIIIIIIMQLLYTEKMRNSVYSDQVLVSIFFLNQT